jgi:hypothetical protein
LFVSHGDEAKVTHTRKRKENAYDPPNPTCPLPLQSTSNVIVHHIIKFMMSFSGHLVDWRSLKILFCAGALWEQRLRGRWALCVLFGHAPCFLSSSHHFSTTVIQHGFVILFID